MNHFFRLLNLDEYFLKDEGFQKGIKMPRSFFKGNSEVIEFLGGKLFPILNAKYHFFTLRKGFQN